MKTNAARVEDVSPAAVAASARSAKRQGLRWFIRAPARMALDRGLSAVAFRLATVLLHYEGELGCFPSQDRLSDDLGISVDSVQRYLRELELYGFLVVEKRGRRNNYRLEPIYEAPIGHGSSEETGQLEMENRPKRTPPSPRTLRARPPTVNNRKAGSQSTAPVRPITEAKSRVQPTALVRPIDTAPLRPVAIEAPHACGTKKNQTITKNQQQQGSVWTDVGDDVKESESATEALAFLQSVGVNVIAADLGIHAGRGRQLDAVHLRQWATWVQSSEKNGIVNKPAFAATKIRTGFTLGDVFPNIKRRESYESEQRLVSAQQAESQEAGDRASRERFQRADALIKSLDEQTRQNLREQALSNSAAWLGRKVTPDTFERLVSAVERRLVLDGAQCEFDRRAP